MLKTQLDAQKLKGNQSMANVNEAAQKYSSLGTRIQKQPEEKVIVTH